MHLAGVKSKSGPGTDADSAGASRSRLDSLMWILEKGNSVLLAEEGPRLSDEALGKPGGHAIA